jgi:hypothetical protein
LESIPQRPEETMDFLDAGTQLGERVGRPMLVGASPRPAGHHGFGKILQSDDFNQQNGFEKPCLYRLGGCH